MAKNFSFRSLFLPATPRSKALRGKAGTVVVNNQSAGVPNTPATTVVNNYNITNNYTQEGGGVQVIRITIADLLALAPEQIQVSDIYAVHSSGSDESGWSKDGEFELNGKKYPDGSYAQYVDGVWLIADKDVVKTENEAIFNPLQKLVSLISKTFSQSSYSNLSGRSKAGIPIAEIRNYELDESGVYKEKKESQTGTYAAETNVMTLLVPYARSYEQGGEKQYSGGALTAADYQKLCEGGGGNVDDVQVNGASVVKDKVAKIDLSNYVDITSNQNITGRKFFDAGKIGVLDKYRPTISFMKNSSEFVYLGIDYTEPNKWYPYCYSNIEEKRYDIALIGHGEYGDETHPIYIDERGRTKKCSISLSDFATYDWVNQQGFLKSIPSSYVRDVDMDFYLLNYAKMEWVDSKGYATQSWIELNFAKKTDLPTIDTIASATPSDDHVPSTKLFADNIKTIAELYNSLSTTKADKSVLSNYYNKTEIDEGYYNKAYLNVVLSELATKGDIEEMCKRIVVKSSKTFSVEELKGVGEILVKPSANMQIILPNDAVAIAGDRITISVIPANNTAGVDIATPTATLFRNSSGYIATMSVTYIGNGWRLWGVQSTSM